MLFYSLFVHLGGAGESTLVTAPAPTELHSKGQPDFLIFKYANKQIKLVPL